MPPGQTFPNPGACAPGTLDSNHSEPWIAVKPGTEDLVGSSKFFFDKYSKFYNFYLGTYRILGGTPTGGNQVQGYDCAPDRNPGDADEPDGCDRSERRVRHQGPGLSDDAAVQRVLGGSTLRPDGAIDVSYSDDMDQHWVEGNGGQDLEQSPTASATQAGHVKDKQRIASHAAAVAAGRRGPAGDARHGPEDQRLGHHALRRHVRPWRLPLPTTQQHS